MAVRSLYGLYGCEELVWLEPLCEYSDNLPAASWLLENVHVLSGELNQQ